MLATARGLLLAYDQSKLAEFGRHIVLNYHWAYTFLRRMNFMQRRATTAKSKHQWPTLLRLKRPFWLELWKQLACMEEIRPELILNWDHTGDYDSAKFFLDHGIERQSEGRDCWR